MVMRKRKKISKIGRLITCIVFTLLLITFLIVCCIPIFATSEIIQTYQPVELSQSQMYYRVDVTQIDDFTYETTNFSMVTPITNIFKQYDTSIPNTIVNGYNTTATHNMSGNYNLSYQTKGNYAFINNDENIPITRYGLQGIDISSYVGINTQVTREYFVVDKLYLWNESYTLPLMQNDIVTASSFRYYSTFTYRITMNNVIKDSAEAYADIHILGKDTSYKIFFEPTIEEAPSTTTAYDKLRFSELYTTNVWIVADDFQIGVDNVADYIGLTENDIIVVNDYTFAFNTANGEYGLDYDPYKVECYYANRNDLEVIYKDVIVKEYIDEYNFPLIVYTRWIANSVEGFFSIQLFEGFTLGGVFMAMLAFMVVMWFLKVFAGG